MFSVFRSVLTACSPWILGRKSILTMKYPTVQVVVGNQNFISKMKEDLKEEPTIIQGFKVKVGISGIRLVNSILSHKKSDCSSEMTRSVIWGG